MSSRALPFVCCVVAGALACSDPNIGDKTGTGSTGSSSGNGSGTGGAGSSGKGGAGAPATGMVASDPFKGVMSGPGGDRDGGPASGGGPAPDDVKCGFQNFMLERLPPEILIILDRSGSMTRAAVGAPGNLWMNVTAALDEVVRTTQTRVNWGLKLFPLPSACTVMDGVDVPIAPMNHMKVVGSMAGAAASNNPNGNTPTADAVRRGLAYLQTVKTPNPKYIVLATDGEPNCPTDKGKANALAAISDALKAGYTMFVVGIAVGAAGSAPAMTLNEMAIAGGAPRMDPTFKYYPVANKADLVASLDGITVAVSNCVFPLDKKPPVPMNVAVDVAGTRVKADEMEGWSYGANMMSIQLHGQICEKVKMGGASMVKITFGCPNVVIP